MDIAKQAPKGGEPLREFGHWHASLLVVTSTDELVQYAIGNGILSA